MKALVASLQANQAVPGANSNNDSDRMIADLQAKLAAKQSDLASSIGTTERAIVYIIYIIWCSYYFMCMCV